MFISNKNYDDLLRRLKVAEKTIREMDRSLNKMATRYGELSGSSDPMIVPILDANDEPVMSSGSFGKSPKQKQVDVRDVVRELADHVGVSLSYRQEDPGYVQAIPKDVPE